MQFYKATPILRVGEKSKALDFYIDYLGFKIDCKYESEEASSTYMQISKGECLIHLSEQETPTIRGSIIRIPTEDLMGYHRLLATKKYQRPLPDIVTQPWNSMDFEVQGPFDNVLVFFENTDGR